MKNLILVIVALLVFIGGLGWFLFASDNPKEPPTKTKVTEDNNTKPIEVVDTNATNPVKELTLREKVVGTYEVKVKNEYTYRAVILKNGIWEAYINGEKNAEHQWKISKEGELHIEIEDIGTGILRINKDGSITDIAKIIDGRRNDFPKERQKAYKKIK